MAQVAQSFAPPDDVARQVANAHVLFNVSGVLLFIWFTPTIARALELAVPDRSRVANESERSGGRPPADGHAGIPPATLTSR